MASMYDLALGLGALAKWFVVYVRVFAVAS